MNCIAQDPGYSRLKDQLIASTGLAFYADRDEILTDVLGFDARRVAHLKASGATGPKALQNA